MADVHAPKDAKRIVFEGEGADETVKTLVGNLKEDIGTEDNEAVLVHLVKSYFDRLAMDGQERPSTDIAPLI